MYDISTEYIAVNTSVLIADLAGYTSLTEVHGDISAAKLVRRYLELVKKSLSADTILVDHIGDEVLIISGNPIGILNTARSLVDSSEKEKNFPSLHIGIHTGNVIRRDGKYFGNTINLTSRICDYSKGGQILCSQNFLNLIKNNNYHDLKLGNVRFKNISKSIPVYEIILKSNRNKLTIDPVCKMQLDSKNHLIKIPYEGNNYFFCSNECSRLLLNNPGDFI